MILESGSNSTHYSYFYNSYITHFRGVRSYDLIYCDIFTFQRPFQNTTIFSRNRVERKMLLKPEPTSSQRNIPLCSTNNLWHMFPMCKVSWAFTVIFLISWPTFRRNCPLFIIAKFNIIFGFHMCQYLQSLYTC